MEITATVPTDVQLATRADAAGDAATALARFMRALATARTSKREHARAGWLFALATAT